MGDRPEDASIQKRRGEVIDIHFNHLAARAEVCSSSPRHAGQGVDEMQSVKHHRTTAAPFINVTPLIDVLLVLLIIFMIISPTRPSKFDAKIPNQRKPGDPPDGPALALVVTINHGGGYALNSQPANTLEELQSQLQRALDGRPIDIKTVFLKAPRA